MDIEVDFLFKQNLWAELVVQVINCQLETLRGSEPVAQKAKNILKYTIMFEKAKKRKKAFSNFVEKYLFLDIPENALVTTSGASGWTLIVLGQTKGKKKSQGNSLLLYI